jgi:RimJ/RimL family protein N-acetyltransferase
MNITILTVRFILRQLQEKDLDDFALLNADEEVRANFPDGTLTREESHKRMLELMDFYTKYQLPCFVILDEKSKEFIGRCGFGKIDTGEVEVGYLICKEHWGKGIATEVLQAMLFWAESHIKVDYIIAFAPIGHHASHRVMQKSGMEYYKNDVRYGVECCFYRKSNR